MKFDYTKKPPKDQVIVGFINDCNLTMYQFLYQKLIDTGSAYDIQFNNDANIQLCQIKHCLIKHCIVLTNIVDPIAATNKFSYLLEKYQCLSICICYESKKQMLNARTMVDQLKLTYPQINYLRPDIELSDGRMIISEQKIMDNLVCDTIRIKYYPKYMPDDLIELSVKDKNFFIEISEIFKDYNLYHRATTDGFISLRYKNGFFITATKTCKVNLDMERVSYVSDYSINDNFLYYSGKYLPSSDVVEAYMVYKHNPAINALIHTHASDRYTRNDKFLDKVVIGLQSYGTVQLGNEINKSITHFYDDFLIMKEHGEVFSFTNEKQLIPKKFKSLLTSYSV